MNWHSTFGTLHCSYGSKINITTHEMCEKVYQYFKDYWKPSWTSNKQTKDQAELDLPQSCQILSYKLIQLTSSQWMLYYIQTASRTLYASPTTQKLLLLALSNLIRFHQKISKGLSIQYSLSAYFSEVVLDIQIQQPFQQPFQ